MLEKVTERARYSDQELQEFKTLIQEKISEARERLKYYLDQLADFGKTEDAKVRGLDDGINSIESDHLATMASRQRKLINHLEGALVRIENKTYGVCRVTGKLISKQRLMAVPHATLSIEAKNRLAH